MTPVTRPYRLLGYPPDLAGHLAALGPLPIPAAPSVQWRGSVAREVEASGLSGRGGAAFPAFIKLRLAASSRMAGTVVVNAMEGEPASHKDKLLLLQAPHLVLDGASILAAVIGATEIVVCIPDGRDHLAVAVTGALRERAQRGIDAGRSYRVARPPERFVSGEESALVRWLDRGIAAPTFRPSKGVPLRIGSRTALVHNAETLAHIALIARFGADHFRSRGLPEEPGTTLVTISGSVLQPGVVEVDRGTPLIDIVQRAAPTTPPQAVLVGGYGGTWVGSESLTTPYASLWLRAMGASAGVGVLVVLGANDCGVAETARIAAYMAGQSSGQCGPCVMGLPAIADDLARLARGQADLDLQTRLWRRLDQIDGRGACRHPDGVVAMVRSALNVFAADVVAHDLGAPCMGAAAPSKLLLPASR
jgi:NADH:ubiquinone oxidoreductase subunit F (NADH-binding)